MDRSNHYEAAFEAYLQWHRLCYVGVDETRRSMLGELRIKSLDFIVHGEGGARLLVDVKGRRFPTGPGHRQRRVWECWSELFGPGYQGLLVFAYHLLPSVLLPAETEDLWIWRGRRYLLRALPAGEYRRHMRTRSPKWGTVSLPGAVFRELSQPFRAFTRAPDLVAAECPF